MRLEYLEDLEAQSSPRVLLAYGTDPRGAAVLRHTVEQLAVSSEAHDVRIDKLPGFQPVEGCSLTASVGSVDSGVEKLEGSERAFRCVLRPATWRRVWGLLEPFEIEMGPNGFQWLSEEGPIEWIISGDRGW